ncbi:MAG TPA: hypothetical protein VFU46_09925 [Gemmatimonadales bacterium]|nr:hypothetical protein [Gemmatimonadales bacterium]
MSAPRGGSLVSAMNWMGGLTLLLFWLPVLGPLVAGLVGGAKAGSVGRAVLATFLPAVLTGLMTAAGVAYLTEWIGWGVLAGLGVTMWLLVSIGPLLVGAIIGGAFSPHARTADG